MSQVSAERVAGNIRAEMGRLRITRQQVAERLNLAPATVRKRLEARENAEFSLDEISRLAEWFTVPVERLLGVGERAAS
jgi:transcriptional regulator with XRE-family HTH domain